MTLHAGLGQRAVITSTLADDNGTTVVSTAPGFAERRADHLARLRKVEGQVRGSPAWSMRTGTASMCSPR
jgi:hypothetical protein